MTRPAELPQAAIANRIRQDLHHVVRPGSGEGKAQGWSERLLLLQKLGRLTGLNQLLQLLQLLRYGVKKLQDLRQRLCTADPGARLARELLTVLLRKRRGSERLARI